MKNNWQITKLGEICDINPTKSETRSLSDGTTVSFVSMSSVDEHSQSITVEESREYTQVKKGYTYFKRGDILFAKITPCMENGKVALSNNLKNEIGFGSTEFHVLRAKDTVLPEYVYHLVRSEFFRNEAGKRMTGSAGQKRVPREFLENYEIPLPPLSTQKEIVKMLDEKMGKIGEAKRLRAEALADTEKILPQTLHEIFEEGKKNGWEEKEIKDVCEKVNNINPEKEFDDKFLYVDIASVYKGKGIVPYEIFTTGNIPSRARRPILVNDVLFALTRPYLKNIAIVEKEFKDAVASTGFSVMRAKKNILNPKYLYYVVNSDEFMCKIIPLQKGATYPAVSESQVFLQKITLPPLAEQQKIVTKLDTLSEKVRTLRDLQVTQLADLKSLERAHLREAFSGELV